MFQINIWGNNVTELATVYIHYPMDEGMIILRLKLF